MGAKTKKIKAAGKFSGGLGVSLRSNYNAIEAQQRIKQKSPFYSKGRVKRVAAGIWKDLKTGKIFAGPAYIMNPKK